MDAPPEYTEISWPRDTPYPKQAKWIPHAIVRYPAIKTDGIFNPNVLLWRSQSCAQFHPSPNQGDVILVYYGRASDVCNLYYVSRVPYHEYEVDPELQDLCQIASLTPHLVTRELLMRLLCLVFDFCTMETQAVPLAHNSNILYLPDLAD